MENNSQGGGQEAHDVPRAAVTRYQHHHRKAHSKVQFRIPEDMDMLSDPFDVPSEEFRGSEDDIMFSSFMDTENANRSKGCFVANGFVFQEKGEQSGTKNNVDDDDNAVRPRHMHSNSVDGSSIAESIEAKKALAPEKLAELWAVDPKRAKRILANRQSAARSKERKSQYISELERKWQTLQTEATTLSAELTLFQRDTTDLTTENTELKFRFQALEQQAQLRGALNETLKKEVERLNHATGESMTPTESLDLGMKHSYAQSSFFPQNLQMQQAHPAEPQNLHMFQVHHFQPELSSASQPSIAASQLRTLPEILQQVPLGRMQRLEISDKSTHIMNSQGSSISVGESSSM